MDPKQNRPYSNIIQPTRHFNNTGEEAHQEEWHTNKAIEASHYHISYIKLPAQNMIRKNVKLCYYELLNSQL